METRRSAPTAPDHQLLNIAGGPKTDQQLADELLAEFAQLPAEERRRAIALLQGKDPDRAIMVRRPDGKIEMQEVSYEDRARILGMGAAGFQSVAFTNRRARRAAKVQARRSAALPSR